ncbi:MAG TPA: DCC1-like thiol-disulfide oxidoreductase family protein [Nitrososphaerales archaeon]|nr:DCC1-like thiol-disulfide oxidoreductase family protein [Nitrososphaerales archaeon]
MKKTNYLLLYDADCGPCTKFRRAIEFFDAHRRIDYLSLTEGDERGFLDGVPTNLRHRSFHLITPDGTVLRGANALPTLIGLLPTGGSTSSFIVRAPGGLATTAFVYSVFSRLHGTGSCSYSPGKGTGPSSKTSTPQRDRTGTDVSLHPPTIGI